MTISQMVSLTNKYRTFVSLIPLLHLLSLITLSCFNTFLVGSAYPLFLSSGSSHTCRFAHLPLPFHLIFFSLIPSHLWRSARLCPWSYPFNLYTKLLSSLISSSNGSHLLYADDTQLFISFTPKNFSLAISDLQSTVSLISSWMSSNNHTLNPSKSEFLLIGLPQPTCQIINPYLSCPLHSLSYPLLPQKISASSLTPSSLSLSKSPSFQALVTIIFAISAVSVKDSALQFFHSYLADRTQSVHLASQSTPSRRVHCGVLHGSGLGPILFTLYTADIGTTRPVDVEAGNHASRIVEILIYH